MSFKGVDANRWLDVAMEAYENSDYFYIPSEKGHKVVS